MLAAILAPVPHEEWMRAVVSVAAAIHLDVAWIIGELAFVFLTQVKGVARFWQQAIEEFDVARMMFVIELVVAWVMNDQHAAFSQQRLIAIEIEVIAESHHLH